MEFESRVDVLSERTAMVRVDDATFEVEVIRSPLPVVVDFYADWCAPCRIIQPTLKELASRLTGRVKFAQVNVDEAEVVTRSFGIHAIPTYLFVESGTEKGREVGPIDPVAFRAVLRRYFAKSTGASGGTHASR
jgi:thioredoxin 1